MRVNRRANGPAGIGFSEQYRAGPASGAFHYDDTTMFELRRIRASNTEGPTLGRPYYGLEILRVPYCTEGPAA